MLYIERREKIIQLLSQQRNLTNLYLADFFNVTLNTIRSDIDALVKEGAPILKVHGGIKLVEKKKMLAIDHRFLSHAREKKIIADLVLKNLPVDKTLSLFFDSSTTNLEIAQILPQYPNNITVITNFIDLALITGRLPNVSTILCGGTWWNIEHSTIGNNTKEDLKRYNPDIAILGASGISIEHGIFNGYTETNDLKKTMSQQAKEVWIVCDHSKWDRTVLTFLFNFSEIDVLITDKKPSQEWCTILQENKIRVIYPK